MMTGTRQSYFITKYKLMYSNNDGRFFKNYIKPSNKNSKYKPKVFIIFLLQTLVGKRRFSMNDSHHDDSMIFRTTQYINRPQVAKKSYRKRQEMLFV